MITGFEKITEDLSDDELKLVQPLIDGLKKSKKPVKTNQIVDGMNSYILNHTNLKVKFNPVKLRKIVNYIRCNSIAPIVASSEGYQISFDKAVLEKHVYSLIQRANAIRTAAIGLEKFI